MLLNRSLLAIVVMSGVMLASEASAQSRGGLGGAMSSAFRLINDKNVAAELELVDEQIEDLKTLQDEMRNIFRESFSGMRGKISEKGVDRGALMNEIREKIQSEMSGFETRLEEILLPHQAARLEELSFQSQVSRGGMEGMLSNPKVKERLGLTDEQIQEVQDKAIQVKEDLEKKIEELRRTAREDVLSVLSSDQQAQIKKMMGDSFEFEQQRGRTRGIGGRPVRGLDRRAFGRGGLDGLNRGREDDAE